MVRGILLQDCTVCIFVIDVATQSHSATTNANQVKHLRYEATCIFPLITTATLPRVFAL